MVRRRGFRDPIKFPRDTNHPRSKGDRTTPGKQWSRAFVDYTVTEVRPQRHPVRRFFKTVAVLIILGMFGFVALKVTHIL